jgi:3-keto-L-gulonate-6-phosphate decarboxylase
MKLLILLFYSLLFISCTSNENTIEDCTKVNKKYKIENVLNYRTGERVDKVFCID